MSRGTNEYGKVSGNDFNHLNVSNASDLDLKTDVVNVKETSINNSFGSFSNEVSNVSSYDAKSQEINTNVNSSVSLDSYQTYDSMRDIVDDIRM